MKTLFINLLTFVVLLLVINLGAGILIKYKQPLEQLMTPGYKANTATMAAGETWDKQQLDVSDLHRWKLPNYADNREAMAQHFREFKLLPSEFTAFAGWSRKPFNGETITINENGDRTHTPLAVEPNGKIVRFFGGSTMWGTGSLDHETIPAYFNALNPAHTVFNHGETEFNSRQNLARLASLFSQGEKADLVVFYNGGIQPNSCTMLPHYNEYHREPQMQKWIADASARGDVFAPMFYQNTLTFLAKVAAKLAKPAPQQTDEQQLSLEEKAEKCADILINNWEMAHALTKAQGGKFIALLSPVAYVGTPNMQHLPANTLNPSDTERYQAFYTAMQKRMKDYTYMFDFSDTFNGDAFIYIDNGHVSPNGNEAIAKRLNSLRQTQLAL